MQSTLQAYCNAINRRSFFSRASGGLATAALASLLKPDLWGGPAQAAGRPMGALKTFHRSPRAKRVIFLFMNGGPSHVDLFDHKPLLNERDGQPIPAEIVRGVKFAMSKEGQQKVIKGSPYGFGRHGESGGSVSELLPQTADVVDDLAIIKSVHSDSFNHTPAVLMMNTGDTRFGRPSLGSWLSYGIGSENSDLPAFVVLMSNPSAIPLLDSYWGSGFLPGRYQGIQFQSGKDPVLFVRSPRGVSRLVRREQLDLINWMNRRRFESEGDPEIVTRIEQFELAYRMQMAIPELTDLSQEPKHIHEQYGVEPGKPSFAANCLLARRMAEQGVRFIQLYHSGWDSHDSLQKSHRARCRETDQPIAALIKDLKQRGLLDDTLVVWGGEFGRTPIAQNPASKNWGRDHHPNSFTMWMAGGGIKPGISYGATDEFGFHAIENKVHIHDLQATILHCLGIDHTRLTFRSQGRDFRLTDIAGNVIDGLLA